MILIYVMEYEGDKWYVISSYDIYGRWHFHTATSRLSTETRSTLIEAIECAYTKAEHYLISEIYGEGV